MRWGVPAAGQPSVPAGPAAAAHRHRGGRAITGRLHDGGGADGRRAVGHGRALAVRCGAGGTIPGRRRRWGGSPARRASTVGRGSPGRRAAAVGRARSPILVSLAVLLGGLAETRPVVDPDGEMRGRPRGWAADHPRIELLRRCGLQVGRGGRSDPGSPRPNPSAGCGRCSGVRLGERPPRPVITAVRDERVDVGRIGVTPGSRSRRCRQPRPAAAGASASPARPGVARGGRRETRPGTRGVSPGFAEAGVSGIASTRWRRRGAGRGGALRGGADAGRGRSRTHPTARPAPGRRGTWPRARPR